MCSGVEPAEPSRPKGSDGRHVQAELLVEGLDDGSLAAAGHVQVGPPPPAVGDGEHVVGHGEPIDDDGQGGAQHEPGEDVGGVVDSEVEPSRTEGQQDDNGDPGTPSAPAAGGHQREQGAGEDQRGSRHRSGRMGVALPRPEDRDTARPHATQRRTDGRAEQRGHQQHDQVRGQMLEAAHGHQRGDRSPGDQLHDRAVTDRHHAAGQTGERTRRGRGSTSLSPARSSRVTASRPGRRARTSHRTAISPPRSRNQPVLRFTWRGRGGGSPEGRRRLPSGAGGRTGEICRSAVGRPGPGTVSISAAPPLLRPRRLRRPLDVGGRVRDRGPGRLPGPGEDAPGGGSPPRDAVVVTSFDFPESELLAEIYAGALEGSGVTVHRELALGPRELVQPALRQGLVDLVPEYLGSALAGVAPDDPGRPGRPRCRAGRAGRGAGPLEPRGPAAVGRPEPERAGRHRGHRRPPRPARGQRPRRRGRAAHAWPARPNARAVATAWSA